MKKEAVKSFWEKNKNLIYNLITVGCSIYIGYKITSLKLDSGIRILEREGYLKFFNPETGSQLTPSEFCQLEIK